MTWAGNPGMLKVHCVADEKTQTMLLVERKQNGVTKRRDASLQALKSNYKYTAILWETPSMYSSLNLTSETLTRPSWKEQSLAFWVHMWRYLHQWHGNEPFTQERQLKQIDRRGDS